MCLVKLRVSSAQQIVYCLRSKDEKFKIAAVVGTDTQNCCMYPRRILKYFNHSAAINKNPCSSLREQKTDSSSQPTRSSASPAARKWRRAHYSFSALCDDVARIVLQLLTIETPVPFSRFLVRVKETTRDIDLQKSYRLSEIIPIYTNVFPSDILNV